MATASGRLKSPLKHSTLRTCGLPISAITYEKLSATTGDETIESATLDLPIEGAVDQDCGHRREPNF